MRLVRIGDWYEPKHGEVFTLEVGERKVPCLFRFEEDSLESGISLCSRCPLSELPPCSLYIWTERKHSIIPLEEAVE